MASSQIAAIPGKISGAAQDAVELQKQKVQTVKKWWFNYEKGRV